MIRGILISIYKCNVTGIAKPHNKRIRLDKSARGGYLAADAGRYVYFNFRRNRMISIYQTLVIVGVTCALLAPPIFASESDAAQYNKILFKSTISKNDGSEVLIREAYFPPNWKAPRHYHNGNLFIYVIEGQFEVTMDGIGKKTYSAGDALQMMPGISMDARNPSAESALKLSVFQVGKPDAPFVVPVQ